MSSLRELQRTLAAAMLSDECAVPVDVAGDSIPAAVRLSVHRNNVCSSLRSALEATFPVTRALVGEAGFRSFAARFVREHPPKRGWLSDYGGEFPGFLESIGQTSRASADVARIEWLRHCAVLAPAEPPLDLGALRLLADSELAAVRIRIARGAFVLSSAFPALTLWAAHRQEQAEHSPVLRDSRRESVLVARTRDGVIVEAISEGERALLTAFSQNATLLEAARAAAERGEEAGLGHALTRLVRLGALARCE